MTLGWIKGVDPVPLVGIGLGALQKPGTLGACSQLFCTLYFVGEEVGVLLSLSGQVPSCLAGQSFLLWGLVSVPVN